MSDSDLASQSNSQSRSASGVSRAGGSKSSNPDRQISQIEKSVTHLLVATKQLLETLTQWSRGNAQEEEVSDVYVRLGYEFNLACRAFGSIGVETADLGPVPDLLRNILEDTLSQPASPQALDNYLPRIRDIIINLLQGLKRKQSRLRSRTRDAPVASTRQDPERQSSIISTGSSNATLVERANDPAKSISEPQSATRHRSPAPVELQDNAIPSLPEPTSARGSLRRSVHRDVQSQISRSESSSTVSGATGQPTTVESPVEDQTPGSINFPHPPPPPPKQDALTALQRGGDLERRASRRFSAYQIQKHLGGTPHGVPIIPPPQNSPIPNRGREVRESMRAITSRAPSLRQKTGPSRLKEVTSPATNNTRPTPQAIPEEQEEAAATEESTTPSLDPPSDVPPQDSPTTRTPDEYIGSSVDPRPASKPYTPSIDTSNKYRQDNQLRTPIEHERPTPTDEPRDIQSRAQETPEPVASTDVETSPSSSKDLTLFLQYKTRVKKYVLSGGYDALTLPKLQLAFIEKFAWNTHNNGVDLPEIYIQDPISGVRHELEDLTDVKDRSVLVLNYEQLDEVKKHFDDGIGNLKSSIEGIKHLLDGQGSMLQRFNDKQAETSKEMARLSAAPTPRMTRAIPTTLESSPMASNEAQVLEIQNLRRDIAVLRQTYSSMSSDFQASLFDIKAKAAAVTEAATTVTQPTFIGTAGRQHVNEAKARLYGEMEELVSRSDDLSDQIEELKKDVVSRGVRPRPQDLEAINKDISDLSKFSVRLRETFKREKPIWSKTWEAELSLVCNDRDELTQNENLLDDIFDDINSIKDVFDLVGEAMKQQALEGGKGSLRSGLRAVDIDASIDPSLAKEGVLDEVRALQPNHEDRLEAIERAEKARQRDLETRRVNEFQKEVERFVAEGSLKKTGGADEVERVRKMKDAAALKEMMETQHAQELERAKKRAEKEAAKAAARTAQATQAQELQKEDAPSPDPVTAENSEDTAHIEPNAEISDGHDAAPEIKPEVVTNGHVGPEHQSKKQVSADIPEVLSARNSSFSADRPISLISSAALEVASTHSGSEQPEMIPLPQLEFGIEHEDSKSVEGGARTSAESSRGSWWKPAVF